MDDHFGLGFGEDLGHMIEITDVAIHMTHVLAQAQQVEQRTLTFGRQGIAGDLGSQFGQPQTQPRPLEAGVAGDQHPLALEGGEQFFHHQHLHGARSAFHRSFSSV